MKQYLMLGDTHGDLDFVRVAAALAAQHDAEIIQVGDWVFLWPSSNQPLVRPAAAGAHRRSTSVKVEEAETWHLRIECARVSAPVLPEEQTK